MGTSERSLQPTLFSCGSSFVSRARLGQHFARLLARGETVQAVEFGHGGAVDLAVGMQDVHDAEAVALADLEVELVVRGRDLERARAEGEVHGLVGDDGDRLARERPPHGFADEVGVTLVRRVHGHGDVGHDRFGARRGDFQETARLVHHLVFHDSRATLFCGRGMTSSSESAVNAAGSQFTMRRPR